MLIKVDDIRKVRQIAKNVSDERVEIYIREAESLDIIPRIGADFYQKLDNLGDIILGQTEDKLKTQDDCVIAVENEGDLPVNEWKFLFGGYYKDGCGVLRRMEGVRKALCYFAYARFVLQHSTNVTPFGVVSKMGDDSSAIDLRALTSLSSEARKIGEEYLSGTLAYWNEVRAVNDFNPVPKRAKRRFLAIGD